MARLLCLYDNAGENFLPGEDTVLQPGTQHLAHSSILFFLFDPTQQHDFRVACRGVSDDPQLKESAARHRQDLILIEAAARIRTHTGLSQHQKHPRPLIVVVTKCDVWSRLIGPQWLNEIDFIRQQNGEAALNLSAVAQTSKQVRGLLRQYAPEIVDAAEGFANEVVYLPASALGRSPVEPNAPPQASGSAASGSEAEDRTSGLRIRAKDIQPYFVEVPMLYALHRTARGLVRVGEVKR
jgi:hypothetical protein